MTSREEIALKLTEANIEKIQYFSKSRTNNSSDILAEDINKFYNYLYDNIKTSDSNTINV